MLPMKILQYLNVSSTKNILDKLSRISIGKKIFISFMGIFCVLLILINLLIINYQKKSLKAQLNENIYILLNSFSKDVIDHIIFYDPLAIDEKITLLSETPGINYILVADKNGRIIGHNDKTQLGKYIKIDINKWEKIDNEGIRHINNPITAADIPIGIVQAGISEEKINQYVDHTLKNLKNYLLILTASFLTIITFVSLTLSKTITKPLTKLKEKMSKIQADKLEICENPSILLCKDVLQCSNYQCPAYGKERCWFIQEAKETCKNCHQIDCKDCIVYKTSCGDEVGYLIETFNEMILKLKKSLEELDKTTKEKLKLEKSSAMAEMAMTVAHEIKNPLNAIKAATSYIKDNFKGQVLREFLNIIDKETERLNELITSFLAYARPVPLNFTKGDLNNVIQDVIKLIETELKEDGKILELKFDLSIPQFYFDHHQIKQAVLNLLVNALDATKEGDTISVITEKNKDFAKITIKDTGTGIPDELLNKIFEPFFTTKTTGSGLGLACVERIVKEHGGSITVNSKYTEGTEFYIEIPIKT